MFPWLCYCAAACCWATTTRDTAVRFFCSRRLRRAFRLLVLGPQTPRCSPCSLKIQLHILKTHLCHLLATGDDPGIASPLNRWPPLARDAFSYSLDAIASLPSALKVLKMSPQYLEHLGLCRVFSRLFATCFPSTCFPQLVSAPGCLGLSRRAPLWIPRVFLIVLGPCFLHHRHFS